jgi:small subunit ribosomal protein S2
VALEASAPEEFDFDAAVGGGIRKAPAAVAALIDEDEVAGGSH